MKNSQLSIRSVLISNTLLIPLLPIGIFFGIKNPFFLSITVLHLALLIFSVLLSLRTPLKLFSQTSLPAWGLWILFLSLVIFLSLFQALPITSHDALVHHLVVPKWWIEADRIHEIPWHEWSYYPMLIELGFTGLMALGLERLTPFYHGIFLLLLACRVCEVIEQKEGNTNRAVLGFFLTLLTPICFQLAGIPLVDLPLAFFVFLGGTLLLSDYEAPSFRSSALWSGIAFGLALSTKYNGFLAVACFLAMFLFIVPNKRRAFSSVLIAGCAAAVVFSPWALKNIAWTGNPLYPLIQIFQSSLAPEALPVLKPYTPSPLLHRALLYGEGVFELIALPIRVFLFGQDNNPIRFDGVFSPLLIVALVPFGVFMKNWRWKTWYGFSWLYLVAALITGQARVRYLAPIYGPLVLLTCLCVAGTYFRTILALQCAWFLNYAISLSSRVNLREFFTKELSTEAYLSHQIPEYALTQFINTSLPKTSKVYLILTGNLFHLYERPIYAGNHYSQGHLLWALEQTHSSEELLSLLQGEHITHIGSHTRRMRESLSTLSDEKKLLWNQFLSEHTKQIYSDQEFLLLEIQSAAGNQESKTIP